MSSANCSANCFVHFSPHNSYRTHQKEKNEKWRKRERERERRNHVNFIVLLQHVVVVVVAEEHQPNRIYIQLRGGDGGGVVRTTQYFFQRNNVESNWFIIENFIIIIIAFDGDWDAFRFAKQLCSCWKCMAAAASRIERVRIACSHSAERIRCAMYCYAVMRRECYCLISFLLAIRTTYITACCCCCGCIEPIGRVMDVPKPMPLNLAFCCEMKLHANARGNWSVSVFTSSLLLLLRLLPW